MALGLSGCSLLVVKPLPNDWSAKSRRAPSCDDGAKLANAVDLSFATSGISLTAYGIGVASGNHIGTGILLAGLGIMTAAIFAHTADLGDDRAADCRAALLDYNFEISKALRVPPSPRIESVEPVRTGKPGDSEPDDAPTE